MVRGTMLHLCVHESQPHEKKPNIAQRKLQKKGCAPGQPHRGSRRLLDQDLVLEEGLLDHGAAVEQLVVGHAGDRASQEKCQVRGLGWQRRFLWMGHYGHVLWKPTELVGVFRGMASAWPTKRPPKRDTSSAYHAYVDSKGRRRSTGRAGLKATEHYPPAFCSVTASLIKRAAFSQIVG